MQGIPTYTGSQLTGKHSPAQPHSPLMQYRGLRVASKLHPAFIQRIFTSKVGLMSGSPTAASSVAALATSSADNADDTLLQYVVLRRDLWTEMDWPLGSIVAQACHASTAALWLSKDDPLTQKYCDPSNLDHMHKVVLEIKTESQLTNLGSKLTEAGIRHKLWVEQPEDFPTCLATAPYPKSVVAPFMKKLKLCKGN